MEGREKRVAEGGGTHPKTFFNFFDVTERVSLHNAERENHTMATKKAAAKKAAPKKAAVKKAVKKAAKKK